MNTPAAPTAALFGELGKRWGWLLALGILAILLGTFGLGRAFTVTLAGVLLYGWLILIEGVVQGVQTFQCRGFKSILWHALAAALHVAAGVIVIVDPLLASEVFTLFLGLAILASGVVRVAMAFQLREGGRWVWPLIGGIVAIALGMMVVGGWPGTSFFVIGLFISIELILNGWAMVAVALAARGARGAA